MCTRYITPDDDAIERAWEIGRRNQIQWARELFPRAQGPFLRVLNGTILELVVGQWALVPWFAKTPHLPYATCNARAEELQAKASYKQPWARGQRCLIPAEAFYEPNWESGKHVPWRFRRADGTPWGLAGLWNTWTDKDMTDLSTASLVYAQQSEWAGQHDAW